MSKVATEAEVLKISSLPVTVELIEALQSADPAVRKAIAVKLALVIPQLEEHVVTLKAALLIATT